MADASINGLNSGLDTVGIIEKLTALNRRPIDLTLAKREIEIEKLASFEDLKSRLLSFKNVVTDLNTENKFLSIAGTFANSSATDLNGVVDISTNNNAIAGTFSTAVQKLAREGKVISEGVASINDKIAQGTFELNVGNKRVFIDINSSNNTLDGLRLAINNSGAGVTASFINDGDNIRLSIAGDNAGEDNTVSANLFQTIIGGGPQTVLAFSETQAAQDAVVIVDGVSISSSSNTVTDAIQGTTLSLTSIGSGTITLSSDIQAIQDKASSFVDGYNELMSYLNEQLFFDSDTNFSGTLFGNFTVQNLQQTLRNIVSNQVSGVTGDFTYLSQVGITTDESGFLSIDDGELADAINSSVDSVSQLFSSKGTTSSSEVTFIGFTEDTQSGTYDILVNGDRAFLRNEDTPPYVKAKGNGNFFAGTSGNSKGLNFRVSSQSKTGDVELGTITLSLGIAELLNREIADLTDASRNGPLAAEIDTVTGTIEDFDKTITEQEERVRLQEENLKARFTNLEIVVGRLNSQKSAFENALAGIQSAFKPRN